MSSGQSRRLSRDEHARRPKCTGGVNQPCKGRFLRLCRWARSDVQGEFSPRASATTVPADPRSNAKDVLTT